MIAGILHEGSGLGNQLHRLVMTRVLALDKGYNWHMIFPQNFKGASFIEVDLGQSNYFETVPKDWFEKKVVENGIDIRGYDPEINFVEDNTIIEGEFQDERYFKHRLPEIKEWLKVEPLEIPDDRCIINFRGGEYKLYPDLFLTQDYWDKGVEEMRKINPNMKFEVHTDDPEEAKKFFPDFNIIGNEQISHSKHTNMGYNWVALRYAKYAIISNSSFAILPRLIRHLDGAVTVLS